MQEVDEEQDEVGLIGCWGKQLAESLLHSTDSELFSLSHWSLICGAEYGWQLKRACTLRSLLQV